MRQTPAGERWIRELRFGGHRQAFGKLREYLNGGDAYCALGVGWEFALGHGWSWRAWSNQYVTRGGRSFIDLSPTAYRKLGLRDEVELDEVTDLNDQVGLEFWQLADVLERAAKEGTSPVEAARVLGYHLPADDPGEGDGA